MKKFIKNNFLGIMIVVLLTSTVGYAAYKYQAIDVGYTPENSNFEVDNVENAIKELYDKLLYKTGDVIYYNPVSNSKCTKAEADSNVNSNGTPTGIDSGCMKWYVISNSYDSDIISMILDHNTIAASYWDSTNNKYCLMKEAKDALDNLTTRSDNQWQVMPRLITAQEIVNITGNTWFRPDKYGQWYWLDTNLSGHSSAPMGQIPTFDKEKRSKYAWLFDYTYGCAGTMEYSDSGCNYEDNNKYNESFVRGYWTSTHQMDGGQYVNAYIIGIVGGNIYGFGYTPVYNKTVGIRPVITIPKNVIK